ncbi:MAG: ribonuclease HI [Mariprofundales bacterium]
MPLPKVIAHTDGACSGNPGPGGWGAWLQFGQHERDLWGGESHSTNQRMELQAAIEAMKALSRPCAITIISDSKYLVQGMNEWIHGWKKAGWKRRGKQPISNLEQWQELDRLAAIHRVTWQWVKGHAGHDGNERADALARRGVTELPH